MLLFEEFDKTLCYAAITADFVFLVHFEIHKSSPNLRQSQGYLYAHFLSTEMRYILSLYHKISISL